MTSGNRAIYDRAMEQSREAARQKQWDVALRGAARALQEFPQDTDARTAVVVALFNKGNFAKALEVLQELRTVDPQNLFFLEYVARANEQLGKTAEALEAYQTLADRQQAQRSTGPAIESLRSLLRLNPNLAPQRQRLAQLLAENGNKAEAVAENLTLARAYSQQNQLDKAAESCETALRLDATSRDAKELLAALHAKMAQAAGGSKSEPRVASPAPGTEVRRPNVGSGKLRSQVFEAERMLAQALELQDAGKEVEAISQYEAALNAGLERSDLFYGLGLLYQKQNQHQAAVKVLLRAASDPEYALSSHFALGNSYQELGQLAKAVEEFEQAIRAVDLETIGKSEVEDLIQMYEQAAAIYQQLKNIARAASLFSTLANFLQSKRWGKEQAQEFNRRAKELTERNMLANLRQVGTGALTTPKTIAAAPIEQEVIPETWGKIRPITDFLRDGAEGITGDMSIPSEFLPTFAPSAVAPDAAPNQSGPLPVTPLDSAGLPEKVANLVTASGKYLEQNLLEASLDACFDVIWLDPNYFPIHLRMGEIYERQKRSSDALTKYQLLIDTFVARGEEQRAIDVYLRMIELAPETISARSRLANLLKNAERLEEATVQQVYVADNYFRIGQTNKALEEYRRGIQWSPRNAEAHAHYGLALFKIGRYEVALGEFHKALEYGDSNDSVGIAHINMTLAMMGEHPAAVWDSLATLLDQIKGKPQLDSHVQAEYRAALGAADEPILHYILAIIQQTSNQHTSALLELEQAQSLLEAREDPNLPIVLVYQAMAESYIALGHADEALNFLRLGRDSADQVKPDPAIKHPFAMPLSQGSLVRRMAEAYAASGDLTGAETALLEARTYLPYDRAVYTKLADIYFQQGKLNEAMSQLKDLATHYEERQELDQALEVLEGALRLSPSSISVSGRLAKLYIRRGYPDKGVEGLTRVAELQRKAGQLKDAVESLRQAAEICWMLGKHDETRIIYDKIVQIAPTDLEARQWLAIMYTLGSRTSEAVKEKKEIARILAQQRDYDNAIAELHQIIGLDQRDLEAYFMLGDMLMRREEYQQAVQLYTRMLKMENVEVDRVEALLSAATRMSEQRQHRLTQTQKPNH